jgi:hypothetical protein
MSHISDINCVRPHISDTPQPFDEKLFQVKIDSAVQAAELILEKNR